jgi:ribosomal protein L1
MEEDRVFENLKAIVDYVADQMPHRYNNIKSMFLKTTMGHPIKVDEQFLKSIEV